MDVNNYASKGVAGAALGTGIGGLALGVLNTMGGLGNLLGGGAGPWFGYGGYGAYGAPYGVCSENTFVDRYEQKQAGEIAELKSQIALRDANTYSDQKMLDMYKYFDMKLGLIDNKLCDQAVHNQRTEDAFMMVRQNVGAVKDDLEAKIRLEAERRSCADNSIVNYVNTTFYPKEVADVTVAATTTAQALYNPITRGGWGYDGR